MAETAKETKKSSKTVIILLIIIIVLLLAGGVTAVILLTRDNGEQTEKLDASGGIIHYDEAAVALDEDSLRAQLEDAQKKAEEGQMALRYQKTAYSSDGTNFICDIGNSTANSYDMYINIYKDPELTEQVLLTGLIPPGSGIKEFESEIPFRPGTYETTLVLTQVEDDHSTFHAQLMVTLELVVE